MHPCWWNGSWKNNPKSDIPCSCAGTYDYNQTVVIGSSPRVIHSKVYMISVVGTELEMAASDQATFWHKSYVSLLCKHDQRNTSREKTDDGKTLCHWWCHHPRSYISTKCYCNGQFMLVWKSEALGRRLLLLDVIQFHTIHVVCNFISSNMVSVDHFLLLLRCQP